MTTEVGARSLTGAGARPGDSAVLTHSTPYPWPYDAAFAPSRCALIVHDTSSPPPAVGDAAWATVARLAAAVHAAGGLVVALQQHRPPRLGRRTEAGPSVSPGLPSDLRIEAPAWDGFYGTVLDQELRARGRDQLLLTGAWLEVGVHSTMRAANDRGYECLLVADACLSGDPALRAASLSSIEMSGGIFGAVGTSTELLDLLAPTPSDLDVIS
ncbi:cysteine hydrolase [Jatrophihabitans sp.]|uniref:cysteine hydrolase family protein n=1 Tax=Jatrophihabitans sp. TaxID=1932789 RepID=UPI0030C66CB0|nr:cysteine hydrolase [Jatrophihabitans sp.]